MEEACASWIQAAHPVQLVTQSREHISGRDYDRAFQSEGFSSCRMRSSLESSPRSPTRRAFCRTIWANLSDKGPQSTEPVRGCTAQLLVPAAVNPKTTPQRDGLAGVEQAPAMLLPGPCWRSSSEEYNHAFNARLIPLSARWRRARAPSCPSNHLAHHACVGPFFMRSCRLPQCGTARDHTQPDGRIHFRLSGMLTLMRRLERGVRCRSRLGTQSHHPGWYWFPPCSMLTESDYRGALEFSQRSTCHLLAYEPRARRDQRTTRELEAARKAERALLRATRLRHSGEDECAKWWEPELVEKLLDGLRKAGLEIADCRNRIRQAGAQDRKTRYLEAQAHEQSARWSSIRNVSRIEILGIGETRLRADGRPLETKASSFWRSIAITH